MPLNIVSVLPDNSATGVILQGAVIVTFDGPIDVTTYTEMSFLLSAPPEGARPTPSGLIGTVSPVTGTDYVAGSFSFALNSAGNTIATFKPARPLRPNVQYTVLISTDVAKEDGTPLSANYNWTFVTGVLDLTSPPPQNPLPSQVGRIDPCDIYVSPSSTISNDLHRIELIFPADIDPASFNPDWIHVDLEAFLQDIDVSVPVVTSKSVTIEGKKIVILLTF